MGKLRFFFTAFASSSWRVLRLSSFRKKAFNRKDPKKFRKGRTENGWSLRCWPSRMGAFGTENLGREGFAVRPDGAFFEVFLLPDGHGALKRVDEPAAGVEGSRAVRGGYHNQHAGLANFQPPEAMDDGGIANLEPDKRLLGQFFHLLQRHPLIGLVVEVECVTAAAVVADYALEDDGSSVLGLLDAFQQRFGVNSLGHNGRMLVAPAPSRLFGERPARSVFRPSAHRRQQCDLVILLQPGFRAGILLVYGHRN